MQNQAPETNHDWCNSCTEVASEFLNAIISTGKQKASIISSILSVNTSDDFTGKCPLCRLLRASISSRMLDPIELAVRLRFKTSEPCLVSIEQDGVPSFNALRGTLALLSEAGTPVGDIIPGQIVCEPGSEAAMSTIRRWARHCDESHATCRYGGTSRSPGALPSLPTRVLDVGSPDQSPTLFVSNGATGEYAALSHCWGGGVQRVTTKANYVAHQREIDPSSLSKTFQESMVVTRSLGFRYLWIDSLCIIQDDEEDWRREAERMGDVYERAYCTIAAAAAPSGDIGCFAQERAHDDQIVLLLRGRETTVPGAVYLAKLRGPGWTHFDQGPLFSRAWVVQERLLSTRVLHFSRDQIYWECREQLVGETGVTPQLVSRFRTLRGWLHEGTRGGDDGPDLTNAASEPIPSSREMWFIKFWTEFVTLYSEKHLTVLTDKIPALQGIAARIERMTKLKFCSGTFFGDSPSALRVLMWRRAGDFLVPNPSGLPSWSWASLDGRIAFHYKTLQENGDQLTSLAGRSLHPEARIYRLPSADPLFPHLQLSSSVISARHNGVNTPYRPSKNFGHFGDCFMVPAPCYELQSDCTVYQHQWNMARVCFDTENHQPESFYIAPLFNDRPGHSTRVIGTHFHVFHLALEKRVNFSGGAVYRRIGLAMTLRSGPDPFPPRRVITLV